MKHHSSCLVLLLSACGLLAAATAVSAIALTNPTQISSTSTNWAATMTVQAARFSNTHMSWTSRQYCYNSICSIPGPTIHIKPGDTFALTVINKLEPEPAWYVHNTFHSPNSTNVHTHGLHIDPNVDSVYIRIAPGANHTYVMKIADDHMPGTHWYHSHSHGNSALQVPGGLYGMLIVDPPSAGINLPISITGLTQYQVVLTQIKWNTAVDSAGLTTQGCCNGCPCTTYQGCTSTSSAPFRPFRAYSYPEVSNEMGNLLAANPVYTSVDTSFTNPMYVNGIYQPIVSMTAGTPVLLRVLNAGSVYKVELNFRNDLCSMTAVAADGVYLTATQTRTTFHLFAATRYDIVVKCATPGTFTMEARYGERDDGWTTNLMTFVVAAGSSSASLPTSAELAAITRPYYLQSLLDVTVTDPMAKNEVHFSQGNRDNTRCGFWLGMGTNCTKVWQGLIQPTKTNPECSFEPFPGSQGGTGYPESAPTGTYKYVTTTGTINEWQMYGLGTDAHPFHLHVHHFQVVAYKQLVSSSETDYSRYYTIGEWRDTLPALDARVTIRFRAMSYPGQSVLHCHVLRHEDLGMMSSVYICDNTTTGGVPGGGCPLRDTSAHTVETYGYNAEGSYDNSDKSSSAGSGSSTTTTSTGDGKPPRSAAMGRATASLWLAGVVGAAIVAML